MLSVADMVGAEAALEEARQVEAKRLAPFEYHSARVYLDKAREQVVDGCYEQAIRFARTSIVYANRAKVLAGAELEGVPADGE